MSESEHEFHKDQIFGEKKMFCDDFVDKSWAATDARRRKDEERLDSMRERERKAEEDMFATVSELDMEGLDDNDARDDSDEYVEPEEDSKGVQRRRKSGDVKTKRV